MEWLNKLIELATGKGARIFWGVAIIIIILGVIIFPYLDANYFYFNRIEKRINNLNSITNLDMDFINQYEILEDEFNDILNEIDGANSNQNIASKAKTQADIKEYWLKFAGGAFLAALLSLLILFQKRKDKAIGIAKSFFKKKLPSFIFCVLFAYGMGLLFALIPTLGNVWINVVLSPIIQLTIIALFIYPLIKKGK